MVHAHAAGQQALERLAERRGETRAAHGLLHLLALLLRGNAVAGQRLSGGERRVLREVHQVQRRLALAQRQLHRALERHLHVLVFQRHRARRIGHHVHVRARALLEGRRNGAHVAQRGAHEQELGLRQREQRHLPRPAAVGVPVEVELVHGHAAHVGPHALAQRLVGQDLRRAADHGRLRVDVRIAGDHAHVLAPEDVHQIEEFLAHERLDGRRVVRTAAGGQRHEVHSQRHERLARARGRAQYHVVAHHEVHEGLLLVGPELYAARGHPFQEPVKRLVGRKPRLRLGLALLRLPPRGRQPPERPVRKRAALALVVRRRFACRLFCHGESLRECPIIVSNAYSTCIRPWYAARTAKEHAPAPAGGRADRRPTQKRGLAVTVLTAVKSFRDVSGGFACFDEPPGSVSPGRIFLHRPKGLRRASQRSKR